MTSECCFEHSIKVDLLVMKLLVHNKTNTLEKFYEVKVKEQASHATLVSTVNYFITVIKRYLQFSFYNKSILYFYF